MKKKLVLTTFILVIVVGTVGFFVGMKYQQTKIPPQTAGRGPNGQGRGARGGLGGATIGEIVSQDANSVTVKLADGSSKIVNISDTTTFSKTDVASKTDLKTGTRVGAFGTANSDGSITAQNIQINPMVGGRGNRAPNQTQKSEDAKEIVIEGSNFSFFPSQISVKKGKKTRIVFRSKDGMHDFRVDEINIVTAVIPAGQEDFVEFTPTQAGQYEFYCSVGNHREMGMKGTLIVE